MEYFKLFLLSLRQVKGEDSLGKARKLTLSDLQMKRKSPGLIRSVQIVPPIFHFATNRLGFEVVCVSYWAV